MDLRRLPKACHGIRAVMLFCVTLMRSAVCQGHVSGGPCLGSGQFASTYTVRPRHQQGLVPQVGVALALQRLAAGDREAGREDQPSRAAAHICRGQSSVGTEKDVDSWP